MTLTPGTGVAYETELSPAECPQNCKLIQFRECLRVLQGSLWLRVSAQLVAHGVGEQGEENAACLGGKAGEGDGVGVGEDDLSLIESASPAGLACVAGDEGVGVEAGGHKHSAGSG